VSGKLNPNVNLVDTLNGSEFTVFAPTDARSPRSIRPHREVEDGFGSVVQHPDLSRGARTGQSAQVPGMHKTVQGDEVTVTGMGNNLKVNNAGVVCGGVRTANATVYLIDTVLMPPAN